MTFHASSKYCYLIRCLESKTVESAQPRNRSIVTRPFPSMRAGSGYETTAILNATDLTFIGGGVCLHRAPSAVMTGRQSYGTRRPGNMRVGVAAPVKTGSQGRRRQPKSGGARSTFVLILHTNYTCGIIYVCVRRTDGPTGSARSRLRVVRGL